MKEYAMQSLMEVLTKTKWTPFIEPVVIKTIAYAVRPVDADNVCDKLIIDGLKHFGVIKDDDLRYVAGAYSTSAKAKADYTEVFILKYGDPQIFQGGTGSRDSG